ncbi:MAG: hypothetical protein AAGI71_11050 [Bacteroidota bacterium]
MMPRCSLATLLCCLVLAVPTESQGQALDREALRFDVGPADALAANSLPLTPLTAYAAPQGYGWTEAPTDAYTRDLPRSRDAFTADGVRGAALTFRADVPAGAWQVVFWMEAGLQDSSTVVLQVNGTSVPLALQDFAPPAEPREAPQRMHRQAQVAATAGAEGLTLRWANAQEPVSLMGLLLVPEPQPATPAQEALLARVAEAGRYPVGASLEPLVRELEAAHRADPAAPFAAYWHTQVQTLAQAEHWMEAMRGWEWATDSTGLSIFDRYHQVVMWLDGVLAGAAPADPLYERALWQRGRMLYWLHEERGGRGELQGARRDLATLAARHPTDDMLAMYLGRPVDLPDACDRLLPVAAAPAWATGQRETLCRLRAIAHWWVTERQAPNGELGGKIGDDVELLRWWTPLLMLGDTLTLQGWQRLAEAVWESPKLVDGYFKAPIDVEHAAEPISDTVPVLAFVSDDPLYAERLAFSAEHFLERWTVRTDHGHRYFRSAWFGSYEVDERPPRNRDVEMNTRAAKAVRYYAWITGDPAATTGLHEWARGWTDAALRTDKGKPRGLIPASVRAADGALNGDEPTWYQANMFWPYFDWPGADGTKMLDQFLFTYHLTGDEALLEPLQAHIDLVRTHPTVDGSPTPGSAAWASGLFQRKAGLWRVAGQWRLLTGNHQHDDLLLRYGSPYLRYRLTGDEGHLAAITQPILESVRYNTPLVTSEAFVTDRAFVTRDRRRSVPDLKAMITGDVIDEDASPYAAVTWEATPEALTVLVDDTAPRRLGVQLFLFDEAASSVTARLWALEPGRYTLTLTDDAGTVRHTAAVEVRARGQRVQVPLPAQTRLHLSVQEAP